MYMRFEIRTVHTVIDMGIYGMDKPRTLGRKMTDSRLEWAGYTILGSQPRRPGREGSAFLVRLVCLAGCLVLCSR